jgi:glycosyltransferase involved in cell wall biosynthesis
MSKLDTTSGDIKISLIIPVYNRPNEVSELLESLSVQTIGDFEVVIVEDGSTVKCEDICNTYRGKLNLSYYYKDNSGPGQSRNYGFERCKGTYGIFLDSDCVIPPRYVEIVQDSLNTNFIDAFGGPDAAHANFSNFQKAINYSMTSFLTTGGIRGNSEKLDKFHPRSFNMGYSREVFETTKGFSKMRFGEDIDMSIRILSNGFKTRLIKEAFVYHKRRTSVKQFFKQIYNSGIARINLHKRNPNTLKLVHSLPAVFTVGVIALLVLTMVSSPLFLAPIALHMFLLWMDSSIKNRHVGIGLISVLTSYIQLLAYGLGFLNATWKRIILNKSEFSAYEKTFYD